MADDGAGAAPRPEDAALRPEDAAAPETAREGGAGDAGGWGWAETAVNAALFVLLHTVARSHRSETVDRPLLRVFPTLVFGRINSDFCD